MSIQISGAALGTLIGGPSATLNDLTDVTITTPLNGQYLQYNSGSSQWVNVAGNYATLAANTFTGAQTITAAGSTTVAQLALNGATNNWISYVGNGVGPPTFTTRSLGTKLVLYPGLAVNAVDYAIGIEGSTLWFSTFNNTTGQIKWYGGTSNIMTLTGPGALSVSGPITSGSALANNIATAGSTTTNPVTITAAGTDTNIGISIVSKGTGVTTLAGSIALNGPVRTTVQAMAALDVDCNTGSTFSKTINGASTFTFSNPPATGNDYVFKLILTHTSGAITWPAAVIWPGGTAPTLTSGKVHLFYFATNNAGATWRGNVLADYAS